MTTEEEVVAEAKRVVEIFYTGRTAYGQPEEMCSDIGDCLVRMFAGRIQPDEAMTFIRDMNRAYSQTYANEWKLDRRKRKA